MNEANFTACANNHHHRPGESLIPGIMTYVDIRLALLDLRVAGYGACGKISARTSYNHCQPTMLSEVTNLSMAIDSHLKVSAEGITTKMLACLRLAGSLCLLSLMILVSTKAGAEYDLDDSQQVIEAIEGLNWITEEYPPFNYRDPETGKITGAAVEVLEHIFTRIGVNPNKVKLKIYPWARGYHKVLNDPKTVLFSTTYTYERLQQMKFVGPVAPNIVAVITPKNKQLSVQSIDDLNKMSISVVRDDIGEQLLITQGVRPEIIDQLNSGLSMVKKLASGRVDAVAYAYATTQRLFSQAGINPSDYEVAYVLKQSTMGYSFHNSTDARVLEPMRKALDELIVNGTLDEIQIKYGLKATE